MKIYKTKYGFQVRGDICEIADMLQALDAVGEGTLAVHTDTRTGDICGISLHDAKDGITGTGTVPKSYGWVGTYDEIACYAEGLHRYKGAERLNRWDGFRVQLEPITD